jgi:two-component system, OmpR family, response regulator
MLPRTLALVDDDQVFREGLARYLGELGVDVAAFADSNELLAHEQAFGFGFFVTDLKLPGVHGTELIKVLRRRTNAGVLAISGQLGADTFEQVITAGADMYLSKPVQYEQIRLAIEAVQRRVGAAEPLRGPWRLRRRQGQLVAPDGTCIDLSAADCALLECFVEAQGEVVSRDTLLGALGWDGAQRTSGSLNAVVFRLRRRVERATPEVVPLQTKSGAGYAFRAPLEAD